MKDSERGVALVIAVFSLTVIGALVAAAFFSGVQEHRMSDSTRRSRREFAAAEARLAQVLRQWPDDGGSLPLFPGDSLFAANDSVIVRRVGADLYLVAASRNALGLLIYYSDRCEPPHVARVEMGESKCYIDSMLQKVAKPRLLGSRGLVHTF